MLDDNYYGNKNYRAIFINQQLEFSRLEWENQRLRNSNLANLNLAQKWFAVFRLIYAYFSPNPKTFKNKFIWRNWNFLKYSQILKILRSKLGRTCKKGNGFEKSLIAAIYMIRKSVFSRCKEESLYFSRFHLSWP